MRFPDTLTRRRTDGLLNECGEVELVVHEAPVRAFVVNLNREPTGRDARMRAYVEADALAPLDAYMYEGVEYTVTRANRRPGFVEIEGSAS